MSLNIKKKTSSWDVCSVSSPPHTFLDRPSSSTLPPPAQGVTGVKLTSLSLSLTRSQYKVFTPHNIITLVYWGNGSICSTMNKEIPPQSLFGWILHPHPNTINWKHKYKLHRQEMHTEAVSPHLSIVKSGLIWRKHNAPTWPVRSGEEWDTLELCAAFRAHNTGDSFSEPVHICKKSLGSAAWQGSIKSQIASWQKLWENNGKPQPVL